MILRLNQHRKYNKSFVRSSTLTLCFKKMKYSILILLLLSPPSYAEDVSQFICTIKGIYTNNDGILILREGGKGLGEKIYVNGDTAEVTGYFGTDDWSITKLKRPSGILSIETATGLVGDGANRLNITKLEKNNQYSFVYTKNWLYISGACNAIYRHK